MHIKKWCPSYCFGLQIISTVFSLCSRWIVFLLLVFLLYVWGDVVSSRCCCWMVRKYTWIPYIDSCPVPARHGCVLVVPARPGFPEMVYRRAEKPKMVSTSSSSPICGLRPRIRGWSVISTKAGWSGGGRGTTLVLPVTWFWEEGQKVQIAPIHHQHAKNRRPWIILHVVSGPWTSIVAALDKGQCNKAVCRQHRYLLLRQSKDDLSQSQETVQCTDCTVVSTCPRVPYMCLWSAVANIPLQYYTRSLLFGGRYVHPPKDFLSLILHISNTLFLTRFRTNKIA